jgi:N-acetylglucosaminyldiphosphoundecaprenol N-acetyl-beta-D-mannosaminyltransferase
MEAIPKKSFMGLDVSVFSLDDLEKYFASVVIKGEHKIFYGHSLWTVPMMKKHPEIYYYGNKADVLTADGRPFYLLCKLFGVKLKCDLSIPQMVLKVLKFSNNNSYKVYLLGATSDVNKQAIHKLSVVYPKILQTKGRDGYFKESEFSDIVTDINDFNPEVLLIGISSPIKEVLAEKLKEKTSANIIIPCGGMIDVIAGKTSITPGLVKKLGLASLYRLAQEPKRLFRRQMYIYFFWMGFMPVLLFKALKDKNFSIPEYLFSGDLRQV